MPWTPPIGRFVTSMIVVLVAAAASLPLLVIAPGSASAASASPLCNGYAACSALPFSTHGYDDVTTPSYWGMTPGDQCTNYAAYVESTVFGAVAPEVPLGNASAWAANARAQGIAVDQTPLVGSVAEWNVGDVGIGSLGHVAVVEAVGPNYIEVSQQDIASDANGYDWERIDVGSPSDAWEPWPDNFIHFPLTPGAGSYQAPTSLGGPVVGMASVPDGSGYWLVDAQGAVSAHGAAANYGSMGGHLLNALMTHIVATPDGAGYWLVAADGGTFSFGDARFFGSMGGSHLNAPVVDMAPTADGGGYWLVASDGGVFAFGDARFKGSMGGRALNQPVVGLAPDTATGGYWLVASDGGIFSFAAPFHGSAGALRLRQPVNGMSATAASDGYWMVAADGGIFTGGDAKFYGSTGGLRLNAPIVGMAPDNATGGYWLVASDGGVFSFHSPFYGAD